MSTPIGVACTVRPIVTWPGEGTRDQRVAPFRAGLMQTSRLLKRELAMLHASDVVLEMFVEERHIRQDGWIRSDANPRQPGVILSFKSRHGPLRYPCDKFAHWDDNLRAIALALEALRKVERYGVVKRAEQYQGWKALPPSGDVLVPVDFATVDEAAAFIAEQAADGVTSDYILGSEANLRRAFHAASKRLHPDAEHGDEAMFRRLSRARDVVRTAGSACP